MPRNSSIAQDTSREATPLETDNRVGIWIDTEKACIIRSNGEMHTLSMDATRHKRILKSKLGGLRGGHPSRSEKQQQTGLNEELRRYLSEVLDSIGDAQRIVVFGPAYVKNELGKALAEDARFLLTQVELVTADRMTPNQMSAWVKRYFHNG
jgi:stalled ribosome rescue protein Dom34